MIKKIVIYILGLIVAFMLCSVKCSAQRLAISTNLVECLALVPNVEVEVSINEHNTLSMGASVAPWNVSERYSLAKITVSPEYKYWITSPYYGHYIGANAEYAVYDLYWDSSKHSGNMVSAGFIYGYSIIISKKCNIVPNIGFGAAIDFKGGGSRVFPVFTKIGVNLQMVLR